MSVAKERMSRRGTLEKGEEVASCVASLEGKGERKGSGGFLDVVAGPVARVIMFRGTLPSFDQVVRRFSNSLGVKTGTGAPQVMFVDEPELDEKEGSEKEGVTITRQRTSEEEKESGCVLRMVVMPTLAVLLLLLFYLRYKLK